MKNLLTTAAVLISVYAVSQPGWNWPEDEKMHDMAKEKQAYYKVLMAQSNYEGALEPLKWLYENNADLNPSIYIDGVKCIDETIKTLEDKERIARLQDSTLWMFDKRVEYFDKKESTLDRKAYAAFKYHYKNVGKFPMLLKLYNEAKESNGSNLSTFNVVPYMTLAKYSYERKVEGVSGETVLEIHDYLSNALDAKEKKGEKVKTYRDKIDAFLVSIPGLLTCDFIRDKLAPKLEANPDDIGTAKKIFNYSLRANCESEDFFMKAAEIVAKEEASYKLLKVLGDRAIKDGDTNKGIDFYTKAEPLAETNEDKFELWMAKASAVSKQGKKSTAKSYALKALQFSPGNSRVYNLIGNLYFYSFKECAGNRSIVMDRAVYIAAYNMYQKAGNSSRMAAAKEQFPSAEEIFNEGLAVGSEVTVGCWINEDVKLMKR